MNWIEFSKERPREEPYREILTSRGTDDYLVRDTTSLDNWPDTITHWAEIKPPDALSVFQSDLEVRVSVLEQRVHELMTRNTNIGEYARKATSTSMKKSKPKPKLNLFREWWNWNFRDVFTQYEPTIKSGRKIWDAGWDAALKWKEGR